MIKNSHSQCTDDFLPHLSQGLPEITLYKDLLPERFFFSLETKLTHNIENRKKYSLVNALTYKYLQKLNHTIHTVLWPAFIPPHQYIFFYSRTSNRMYKHHPSPDRSGFFQVTYSHTHMPHSPLNTIENYPPKQQDCAITTCYVRTEKGDESHCPATTSMWFIPCCWTFNEKFYRQKMLYKQTSIISRCINHLKSNPTLTPSFFIFKVKDYLTTWGGPG